MRPNDVTIERLTDPTVLTVLAREADAEGHRMVTRFIEEWTSGENRFEINGERAYVAIADGQLCGVCGLNVDPFAGDEQVGRVRRLYVSQRSRRRGVGSALMQQLMTDAHGRFRELRLRTPDAGASAFYESLGFAPVTGIEKCTHRREL